MDQWNTTESQETNPCILTKVPETLDGKRGILSINVVGKLAISEDKLSSLIKKKLKFY